MHVTRFKWGSAALLAATLGGVALAFPDPLPDRNRKVPPTQPRTGGSPLPGANTQPNRPPGTNPSPTKLGSANPNAIKLGGPTTTQPGSPKTIKLGNSSTSPGKLGGTNTNTLGRPNPGTNKLGGASPNSNKLGGTNKLGTPKSDANKLGGPTKLGSPKTDTNKLGGPNTSKLGTPNANTNKLGDAKKLGSPKTEANKLGNSNKLGGASPNSNKLGGSNPNTNKLGGTNKLGTPKSDANKLGGPTKLGSPKTDTNKLGGPNTSKLGTPNANTNKLGGSGTSQRTLPTKNTKSTKDADTNKALKTVPVDKQKQAGDQVQKNKDKRDQATKPTAPKTSPQPKKAPIPQTGPGSLGSGFGLRDDQQNIIRDLNKSTDPALRKVADDIAKVKPLSQSDIDASRKVIGDKSGKYPPELKNALAAALLQDQKLKIAAQTSTAIMNLQGLGTLLKNLPGSLTIPVLPGQSVVWPGVIFPQTPGDLSGAAIVTSIAAENVSVVDGVNGAVVVEGQAVTDVWQGTRYLRLGNDRKEKVRVWVQYYTQGKEGEWGWSPEQPSTGETALVFDLEPGETTDLMDGDWRLNAQRVRIWAQSDTQEWTTFKDKSLWLVPEVDAQAIPGYVAAEIQTFNFTIR